MGTSGDNINRARPLIIGVVLGLIVGLGIGLAWAWLVQPAYYAGGAYPNELSDFYQHAYVQSVAEAYMTTRDVGAAAERLNAFSATDKVRLLADVDKGYIANGQAAEATLTAELASALMKQEGWSSDDVARGLTDASAPQDFAAKLGQAVGVPLQTSPISPPPGATATVAPTPTSGSGQLPTPTSPGSGTLPPPDNGGFNWGRLLLILLFLLIAFALIAVLISRLRKPRSRRTHRVVEMPPDDFGAESDVPADYVRLGQWTDTYMLGDDNHETSFSVENAEGKFVGECGIGILEGFASGSPKRVLAFDAWLFDKTDIRTISVPLMSEYAFNDDILRSKLPRLAEPVMAEEGKVFELETSALLVKARILEMDYGDGPPDNSYFASLKVRLTAYLKPDIDVDADMPIPEGYE